MKKVVVKLLCVALASGVTLADQVSKIWALHQVPLWRPTLTYPFGGIPLIQLHQDWTLSLNRTVNHGAAWGMMQDWPGVLLILRILILLTLLVMVLRDRVPSTWQFPLACIIGGALGNLLDIRSHGAVIDFIHVRLAGWSFPLFNIADAAITLGIVWLFALSILQKPDSTELD